MFELVKIAAGLEELVVAPMADTIRYKRKLLSNLTIFLMGIEKGLVLTAYLSSAPTRNIGCN